MPANRAGAPCICCKAYSNATTVAMPSTGNASVRVHGKASRARTPITAAWAQTRTALAASESVRIRGYGFNAGQFGVGHVPCGAEFRQEFSHLAEDRPTWD